MFQSEAWIQRRIAELNARIDHIYAKLNREEPTPADELWLVRRADQYQDDLALMEQIASDPAAYGLKELN